MSVGAQGIGQDLRIAPVILGAGHGEAVAEPVELFRIDRVGLEPAIEQRFDDRAVPHFDRDGDRGRLRSRHRQQPSAKIGKAGPAMGKGALADHLAVGIDQTNLVRLACPVDAGEPSGIVGHRSLLQQSGLPRRVSFPVLALLARLPTGLASRPTRRGTRPPQVLETQGEIQTGSWTR